MKKYKKSPVVSIIMCTRNRAHIIGKAIESVLRQSFKDFELIIVDDGSTDNTKQVVEQFKNKRLIYINREHIGLAASRNLGLKEAKGEYIAYCDDDFIFYKDHIKKLTGFLKGHPYTGLVYSDALCQFPEREKFIQSFNFDKRKFETTNFFSASNVIHRKVCIDKAGKFDEKLLSSIDWDMWLRISDIYTIRHLPIITGTHFYYDDITTVSTLKRKGIYKAKVISKRLKRAQKNNAICEYISECSIGVVASLISSGNLEYASTLSDYFYQAVKIRQTIACLGICSLAKGDFKAARNLLKKSLAGIPANYKDLDSWQIENILTIKIFLASAYYNLGNISISTKICKDILHIMPGNVLAAGQLARCYIKNGFLKKALYLLKNYGYNSVIYNLRGICYFKEKSYKKALRDFKNALILSPRSPIFHYNLATLYAEMKKRGLAINEYKKVLALAPNHPQAKAALRKMD